MNTNARNSNDCGTVAGLYRSEDAAEKAIQQLSAAGFARKNIGLVVSDRSPQSSSMGERLAALFKGEERDTFDGKSGWETLQQMCIPSGEIPAYEQALRSGAVLLTVDAGDRSSEAQAILHGAGTLNAREHAGRELQGDRADGEHRIQLLGETLRVHKDRVQRGAVQVRKETVTEQQRIDVPVRREEVVIERHPASGQAASGEIGRKQEIRVPVSEEQVRVEKRPEVREEVSVSKRPVEDTQRVNETVRHEKLRTDAEGDVKTNEKRPGKVA
ncbi:MAG TPA: YsnF/AvaK domain-containing protein [Terriglobales bacterium]|nr:YsnF/AvaK domain-containing protein [Terriglobales bacterium]